MKISIFNVLGHYELELGLQEMFIISILGKLKKNKNWVGVLVKSKFDELSKQFGIQFLFILKWNL